MKCELKSLKVCRFASQETTCYEAKLFIDGKFAAHCSNAGRGGPDNIRFKDRELEARFLEFAKAKTGADFEPGAQIIAFLIDEAEERKQFKRWCKKAIVFRLVGDAEGKWRMGAVKYTPESAKGLREYLARTGKALECVLNEKIS